MKLIKYGLVFFPKKKSLGVLENTNDDFLAVIKIRDDNELAFHIFYFFPSPLLPSNSDNFSKREARLHP